MNKYKAAVIGLGSIGSSLDKNSRGFLSHCGAYKNHDKIELCAVCDKDISKLDAAQKKWRVKKGYLCFKDMLSNAVIDIISIATPPEHRLEICRAVSENKHIKGVFLEKPPASDIRELMLINNMLKNKSVIVNYIRDFSPSFDLSLKKSLVKTGNTVHINCVYSKGIMNSGIHLLRILTKYFGTPVSINVAKKFPCLGNNQGIDYSITLQNNTTCFVKELDYNNYDIFSVKIYGTKGATEIDDRNRKIYCFGIKKDTIFDGYYNLNKLKTFDYELDKTMLKAVDKLIEKTKNENDSAWFKENKIVMESAEKILAGAK